MAADVVALGPGSLASTFDTLHRMRALTRRSVAEPVVRFAAAHIVQGLGADPGVQAHAIRDWLAGNVEFLRDPRGVEYLHSPAWLLARGYRTGLIQGDCDDVAMLGAALGLAIGLRARFWIVGRRRFEHVFAALGDPAGKRWWHLDTTRPAQGIDPEYFRRRTAVEV